MATLVELIRHLMSHRVTPTQLVENALTQITKHPSVFIYVNEDSALQQAHDATKRWQQHCPISPVDGIPISWKDLFDIKGTRTTAGSKTRSHIAPASAHADLVSIMEKQGLIAIGKTNLTEFAYSGLGLNPHFGTPTNPQLDNGLRIPGGSSSGAAIAVATDCVALSIGTDTAGSIRIPAALNGLVGYRSSSNRYSKQGVFPLSNTLDALGPIAHTVQDCILFDALTHQQDIHKLIAPRQSKLEDAPSYKSTSIVIDRSLLSHYDIQHEVMLAFNTTINRLKERGFLIKERSLPSLLKAKKTIDEHGWLGALEAFELHKPLLDSAAAIHIDPYVRERLEKSRAIPHEHLLYLRSQRLLLIEELRQELKNDLVLLPTVVHTAPTITSCLSSPDAFTEINLKTLCLTMLGSLLDCPSITIPNGIDTHDLPVGMQLMGISGNDNLVLQHAQQIEHFFNPLP